MEEEEPKCAVCGKILVVSDIIAIEGNVVVGEHCGKQVRKEITDEEYLKKIRAVWEFLTNADRMLEVIKKAEKKS